jgi:glycerol-3-phosphate dehydrogenase (NAD(P)+)
MPRTTSSSPAIQDASLNDLRVAVLGGGAYGTFVTHLLSEGRGDLPRPKSLHWCVRRQEVANTINSDHRNTRSGLSEQLSEVRFSDSVRATTDLQAAVAEADIVVACISSEGLPELAEQLSTLGLKEGSILILTQKSLLLQNSSIEGSKRTKLPELPTDLFSRALGSRVNVAFFSGAGYADDLTLHRESSKRLVISATDSGMAEGLARLLSTDSLAVKAHEGLRGVGVGSAMKNFGATLMGVAEALDYPQREQAFLFHQLYLEMMQIIRLFEPNQRIRDARTSAVHADLFLTVTGKSRNRDFGRNLVEGGLAYAQAQASGRTIEGINATRGANILLSHKNIPLPLVMAMNEIFRGAPPRDALARAMDTIRKRDDKLLARGENRQPESARELQSAMLPVFDVALGILDGMKAPIHERSIVYNLAQRDLRRAAKICGSSFHQDLTSSSAYEGLYQRFNFSADAPEAQLRRQAGAILAHPDTFRDLNNRAPLAYGLAHSDIALAGSLFDRQHALSSNRRDSARTMPFLAMMHRIVSGDVSGSEGFRQMIRDTNTLSELRPADYERASPTGLPRSS